MEYEAVMAVIADGGGFDNVVRLIFDNNVHINFCKSPQEKHLKKSDFVMLGGTWCYKESFLMRDKNTYEYTVPLVNYHPLECLQSIIMSADYDKIDVTNMNDMIAQITS